MLMWKMEDEKVIRDWIFKTLYHARLPLTDWERGFIVSIDKQLSRWHTITEKQQNMLERIYSEKT